MMLFLPQSASNRLTLLLSQLLVWLSVVTMCRGFNCLQSRQRLKSHLHQFSNVPGRSTRLYMENSDADKMFSVIVKAEIQPDRIAEFLKIMEINSSESRKEPGCLRFDVLRSQEVPNQFFFYELYKNSAAMDYHKQQSHFQAWSKFKASGGTIESITYKTDPEFLS